MANPQLENGHLRVANEIWDALCRLDASGSDWKILMYVIRKTYGYRKTVDWIPLSQFTGGTDLGKPAVCRGLKRLTSRRIITRIDNATRGKYKFNKNFDEWQPLPKQITTTPIVTRIDNGVTRIDNKSLPELIPSTDNTTDNISKDNKSEDFSEIQDEGLYARWQDWKENNRMRIADIARHLQDVPNQMNKLEFVESVVLDLEQQLRNKPKKFRTRSFMSILKGFLKKQIELGKPGDGGLVNPLSYADEMKMEDRKRAGRKQTSGW